MSGHEVSIPVWKLRRVAIALRHSPDCKCENCTSARFTLDEALRPYVAVYREAAEAESEKS